jgi:hypothetical protein
MLNIADEYEGLAKRVEGRSRGQVPDTRPTPPYYNEPLRLAASLISGGIERSARSH